MLINNSKMDYRQLTCAEIEKLQNQGCRSNDWHLIEVSPDFAPSNVHNATFSGKIRLGNFKGEFVLAGGVKKLSGIRNVYLHNVSVGNGCCIENIKNYIANYDISDKVFIENIDCMIVDGRTTFGNGTEVSVLSETGGREVIIHDKLSAHEAYLAAMYRHRPELALKMKTLVQKYAGEIASERGYIGNDSIIVDTGYIKNVKIGSYCKIEGAGRLKNGSLNSNKYAPIHIGYGVEQKQHQILISCGRHVLVHSL